MGTQYTVYSKYRYRYVCTYFQLTHMHYAHAWLMAQAGLKSGGRARRATAHGFVVNCETKTSLTCLLADEKPRNKFGDMMAWLAAKDRLVVPVYVRFRV